MHVLVQALFAAVCSSLIWQQLSGRSLIYRTHGPQLKVMLYHLGCNERSYCCPVKLWLRRKNTLSLVFFDLKEAGIGEMLAMFWPLVLEILKIVNVTNSLYHCWGTWSFVKIFSNLFGNTTSKAGTHFATHCTNNSFVSYLNQSESESYKYFCMFCHFSASLCTSMENLSLKTFFHPFRQPMVPIHFSAKWKSAVSCKAQDDRRCCIISWPVHSHSQAPCGDSC